MNPGDLLDLRLCAVYDVRVVTGGFDEEPYAGVLTSLRIVSSSNWRWGQVICRPTVGVFVCFDGPTPVFWTELGIVRWTTAVSNNASNSWQELPIL